MARPGGQRQRCPTDRSARGCSGIRRPWRDSPGRSAAGSGPEIRSGPISFARKIDVCMMSCPLARNAPIDPENAGAKGEIHEVPSLRRPYPDQVQRVTAFAVSQPAWGTPRNAANVGRAAAVCQCGPRARRLCPYASVPLPKLAVPKASEASLAPSRQEHPVHHVRPAALRLSVVRRPSRACIRRISTRWRRAACASRAPMCSRRSAAPRA